jgi:hypothetical protein
MFKVENQFSPQNMLTIVPTLSLSLYFFSLFLNFLLTNFFERKKVTSCLVCLQLGRLCMTNCMDVGLMKTQTTSGVYQGWR